MPYPAACRPKGGQAREGPSDYSRTIHVLGDVHVGGISTARKNAVLNDSNSLPTPLCTILPGDYEEDSTDDAEALAFIAAINGTSYILMAGHELLPARSVADWKTAFSQSETNYTVNLVFAKLIIIGGHTASSHSDMDATALTFLDTELGNTALPCLVVKHEPLPNSVLSTDTAHYYSSMNMSTYSDTEIRSILAAHTNAIAWIAGHTHAPWDAPSFLKIAQMRTHNMALLAASSVYYTDILESPPSGSQPSLYVQVVSAKQLVIHVRDHKTGTWLACWTANLATGLTEVDPLISETFSSAWTPTNGLCRGWYTVDASSIISASGGLLAINGTPAASTYLYPADVVFRTCGRALCLDVPARTTIANYGFYAGFFATTMGSTLQAGFMFNNATSINLRFPLGSATNRTWTVGSNTHQFIVALRTTGAILLARDSGDAAGVYKILYIEATTTQQALLAGITLSAATPIDITVDNPQVKMLTGGFLTQFGLCTVSDAITTDGEVFADSADGWTEHTITAQTGVDQDLLIRRVDDNNCLVFRVSMSDNTFKLYWKNGGVETLYDSWAQTWVNGTTYRLLVYHVGTSLFPWVNEKAMTSRTSTWKQTTAGAKVTHAGTNYACWPATVTVTV